MSDDEVTVYDIEEWLSCPACGARGPAITEEGVRIVIGCSNCLAEAVVLKDELTALEGLIHVHDAMQAIRECDSDE